MKIKGVFLAAILTAVLCFSGNLLAYSGGNGTAGKPYQIANVADFNQLSTTPTDWSLSFILTANIKLSSLTFTQAPIAPDTNSATAGFQGTKFTGVFDGNGHIIGYLTINAPAKDYIGLFGYTDNATIQNLCVVNVDITGRNWVGGLVGLNSSGTGTLTACYVTGSVSGGYYVGGLVGFNYYSPLTYCYATSSVNGTGSYVGGLVGENCYGSSITACYATGAVNGTVYDVGGLVGINRSPLTACYSTGAVSGEADCVGGLVGYNYFADATITNCYATGSVEGTAGNVGGLVGYNDHGLLTSSYAAGSVSGGADYVGGLVGYNYSGPLTACFWDMETSNQTNGVGNGGSTGVTGKSTEAMKTLATFTSADWDFLNVWDMEEVQTYPFLRTTLAADLNKDHEVNFLDFAIFADQWLEGI